MADDLTQFDEWFGRIVAGLAPSERQRAALKLGQALRRSNLKRIGENVDPDGQPFEPRKPRLDRRGRLRQQEGGKMFRGLRYARHWKIDADAEGVEITAANPIVDRVASVSQFQETITVGRLRGGGKIRVRYPERRLWGFSQEDQQLSIDIAAEMLGER